MKNTLKLLVWLTLSAGLCALCASCETSSGSNTGLTVAPSSTELEGESAVLFTASGGSNITSFLPLRWSVGDPSLGNIVSSSGLSAVYRSTGRAGSNSITVRDQADNEGLALVNQGAPVVVEPTPEVDPPETLPIGVTPIPTTTTTTIVITNATSSTTGAALTPTP
ncbi:MAG: hypothetical protein ACI9TH_002541 [Kiritimatiellia bacterium]|jgi:hypothetical protein